MLGYKMIENHWWRTTKTINILWDKYFDLNDRRLLTTILTQHTIINTKNYINAHIKYL